jgi:hypothetical protein
MARPNLIVRTAETAAVWAIVAAIYVALGVYLAGRRIARFFHAPDRP